jgi:hypothetical protein
MSRNIQTFFLIVLGAYASTVLASAQAASSHTETSDSTSSSPVAYVYVATYNTTAGVINEYSAASNGALTSIPGSPVSANGVYSMAVNGKWLFTDNNANDIDSYSIGSNGALTYVTSINGLEGGDPEGGPETLFLDHTGATLYDLDVFGNQGANNTYQFWDVNQGTGALTYLGMTDTWSAAWWSGLSFSSNNLYAYSSNCYHFDGQITAFSRASSGALTELNISPQIPTGLPAGEGYCPDLAAADADGHLAIMMVPTDLPSAKTSTPGPAQIATYTIQSDGNLTTTSEDSNMPAVSVGSVYDYWMSPSGKLLAVAGSGGLQVFHFNGANPATPYTGLLTTDAIQQVFWDNSNHLYALSPQAGELFVFTVTPWSYSQASGSPYSIPNGAELIVLPE